MLSSVIGIGVATADPSISLAPAASLTLIPAAGCSVAGSSALAARTSNDGIGSYGIGSDGVFDGTSLRAAQVDTAATIVKVGRDLGVTDRGIRIALAVAMNASSFTPTVVNTPFVGLFQQQADPASGLYENLDRADPTGAATMFYEQLLTRVPGYEADSRADWELGEAVQESGRGKEFDQWAGLAAQLFIEITSPTQVELATPAPSPSAAPAGHRPVAAGFTGTINFELPLPALRSNGVAFAGLAGAAAEPAATGIEIGPNSGSASDSASAADSTSSSAATGTSSTGSDSTATDSTATDPTATDPAATDPTSTDPTVTAPTGTGSGSTDPGTPPTTTTEPTTAPATDPTAADPTTDPSATDPTGTDPSTAPPTSDPVTIPADNVGDDGAIIVPELPELPVPTGTEDDPQVGDDPSTDSPRGSTDTERAAASAVLDCAPDTNGGSTTFDPGEIISDAVFYNSSAMTADQVNTFIQEKGTACQGQYCLKNLRVNTPNVAADKYCAAYAGGANETAAAVIAKVSVACRVNPQVMLVTLQKESALLTKTNPTLSSYNAAWGWHCPDTGPGGSANCDPAYAGFFNQAFGMAKQWSRYVIDPQKYNYRAGQTTKILWNVVESGCGGALVTIRNTATASLYNYTPYQPNAAALAAYPGVGDRCSTYGNRNFFFLFQKYFGVTGGGARAYVVVDGVDVTIPAGPNVAAGAAGQVITAPNAAVARGIAAGLASIGLPYVWGGGTNNGAADQGCSRGGGASNSCQGIVGFDCSGLTGYVLSQAGFATGTNSASQRSAGVSVPWNQAIAGDIIGYSGHVAVYLGKIGGVDFLLESPTVGRYVQVRPVYLTNNGVAVDSVLHRYWS